MQVYRSAGVAFGAVLAVASLVFVQARQQPPTVPVVPAPRMPLAPQPQMGAAITPAYEGWVRHADGTATMIVGYNNRNQNQALDIPVGPNNRIDPGGPDFGQPTHFLTGGARNGRQYGVFAITVPKDFATKRLTWTIVANGQAQSIPLWLNVPYAVGPYFRADNGNSPPVVKFSPTGPELTGPPRGMAESLTTTGTEPVTLTLWASDKGNTVDQQNQFGPPPPPARGRGAAPAAAGGADAVGAARGGRGAAGAGGAGAAPARGGGGGGGGGGGRGGGAPIQLTWSKHRGPGTITFGPANPPVVSDPAVLKMFSKEGDYAGKAATTATFSEPGEYVVRGQVNDASGDGGGGDQCCWTNVFVKVTVRPAAGR